MGFASRHASRRRWEGNAVRCYHSDRQRLVASVSSGAGNRPVQKSWPCSLRKLRHGPLSRAWFAWKHARMALSPCSVTFRHSREASFLQALSPQDFVSPCWAVATVGAEVASSARSITVFSMLVPPIVPRAQVHVRPITRRGCSMPAGFRHEAGSHALEPRRMKTPACAGVLHSPIMCSAYQSWPCAFRKSKHGLLSFF